MDRLADLIIRYPKFIILVFCFITLIMVFGLTRLETHNNYEGDLPASDPIVQTIARFEEVFGNEQLMMVAVESPNLFSIKTLNKIARLSEALSTVEGVPEDGVISLATLPVSGSQLPGSKSLLTDLLEYPHASDAYRQERLTGNAPAERLVSDDGTTTQILVQIARTADQSTVAHRVSEIVEWYEGPERLHIIGDFIVAQEIDDGIEGDMMTLLPIALTFVLTGFWVSFRSFRGVAIPLLVISISIVWTLGLMGFLGFHLNVVTSTIPILLVATASSYGIHMVHRFNGEQGDRETAVRRVLLRLGPTVLLTGFTSIVGTLTLLLFQIISIREFGIFAATGILISVALALILAPSILLLLKQPESRTADQGEYIHSTGDRILLFFGAFSLKHKRLMLVMTILIVLVAGVGVTRIRLGLDPVELFPRHHPVREATKVINERFLGARYFSVMVEGRSANEIKTSEFLNTLSSFEEEVIEISNVTATHSIIEALQGVHTMVNQHNPLPFSIPESQQDIEAYFGLLADFNDGRKGNVWVDREHRRAQITVMTTATDHEEQLAIYQRLQELTREYFPQPLRVEFGGPALLWIAQNHYVAIGKIYNITVAILLVLVLCASAFRSIRKGLISVAPLAIATLCTFGVMGYLGIRLNMATAIVTSIAVGIGVDFAVHFFNRLREELAAGHTLDIATRRTILTAGKAICYDVTSNVLGFMIFVFSGFTPIQDTGWLVSLTMVTCAIGTLVLLPSLSALAWKGVSNKSAARVATPDSTNRLQPIAQV